MDKIIIYDSIADVKHESTRNTLYIQFCKKYFPEMYEVLTTGSVNKTCAKDGGKN